jgi:hypothetical protein
MVLENKEEADLLRADLVYESYVTTKEFKEKRSLVRHRISLVKNGTMLENKVHSLLDKYDYKSELADIFGKSGIIWLKTLDVSTIDGLIMNTTLATIENINLQIDTISKELAKYGWDSDYGKIPLSITGIDVFSAMFKMIHGCGSMASENKYDGNNCDPFFLLVKISEGFLII